MTLGNGTLRDIKLKIKPYTQAYDFLKKQIWPFISQKCVFDIYEIWQLASRGSLVVEKSENYTFVVKYTLYICS